MRKAINLKRIDGGYAEREERMHVEKTRRAVMLGTFIVGTISVIGSLAIKVVEMFGGKRGA